MKEFIDGFKEGFKSYGQFFATIVNSILLTLVYFIGVGLSSMMLKMMGKKHLKKNKRQDSYWEQYNLSKRDEDYYYRQF